MAHRIRILLVRNHHLLAGVLRSFLERIEGLEVVAESNTIRTALPMIRRNNPDILLSVGRPRAVVVEAAKLISRRFPQTRILVIALDASQEAAVHALRVGIAGYLNKKSGVHELEKAIRTVARGEVYLTPPATPLHFANPYKGNQSDKKGKETLTPRQQEVLILISEGYSTKEIAERLSISIRTVETHRFQLMERLNIRNIAGLVRFALRTGLVKTKAQRRQN